MLKNNHNLKAVERQITPQTQIERLPYVWENPGKAINREGQIIDTSQEVWYLGRTPTNIFINWGLVEIEGEIQEAMKAYIFRLIESQEPHGVRSALDFLRVSINQFSQLNSISDLTYEKITEVLLSLRAVNQEWKFGYFRRWYNWCFDDHLPGFDQIIVDKLNSLKITPNSSGIHVLTRNPEKGPFSDEEFRLITQALQDESVSLSEKAGVMILLELGCRPRQVILLDESDLKIITKDDKKLYSLDVTKIKQNIVGEPEKKRCRISNNLGEAIELLIKENHELYDDSEIIRPLFYNRKIPGRLDEYIPDDSANSKDFGRMTREIFSRKIKEFGKKSGIISPRTQKPINLNPYRFRYTFGTKHANQGVPANVLASMFEHKSTQSSKVYTKSTSNAVERLNATIGSDESYQQIMGMFLGKIIERPDNPSSQPVLIGTTPTLKNLGGIGQCGANFLCKLYPPLSCYVCPKFEPWRDGPHEQMLEELKTYVRQLREEINNPSNRIPLQLDEVIQAIEVLLLKIKNKQIKQGENQ